VGRNAMPLIVRLIAVLQPIAVCKSITCRTDAGFTVPELQTKLNVKDNILRYWLEYLEEAGLVRRNGIRKAGIAGRPATLWIWITPD
jgi:predicted ArsR family transcriptional regulator